MNIKKLLTISILLIFVFGMIVGAADAAHTVKKGKYKAKLTNKEYKKLTMTQIKYKTVTKWVTSYDLDGKVETNEKYNVKVPYKVRAKAEVRKVVGYGKVKLDRVVDYKYKTVYKYRTVKLKQVVYNAKTDTLTSYRGTHLKYLWKDWKLVKTITQYKPDGSFIDYDVIKSKKKVAVKQTIPIIKAVKVKKPILMNIRTTNSANRLLQGKKVYVEIYCSGSLLGKGIVNIK